MKELVWAISVEYMVDDGYGSFFSLFKNYDDALAAFQEQVEEETEWIGADSYTEEDKDENGKTLIDYIIKYKSYNVFTSICDDKSFITLQN